MKPQEPGQRALSCWNSPAGPVNIWAQCSSVARTQGRRDTDSFLAPKSGGAADPERVSALGSLTGLGACSGPEPGGGGGRVEGADRQEQGKRRALELGGRVIVHPGLSGTSQILSLQVPCSGRPLRQEQTRMAGHPTC